MTHHPFPAPSRRKFLGRAFVAIALCASFAIAAPVHAQSLTDLKASGKIGEAYDGFARARDGSVQATVNSVNAKRRAIYNKRAGEQGTSADQVGRVYATQIIAKAPGGTWILMENGSWRQK